MGLGIDSSHLGVGITNKLALDIFSRKHLLEFVCRIRHFVRSSQWTPYAFLNMCRTLFDVDLLNQFLKQQEEIINVSGIRPKLCVHVFIDLLGFEKRLEYLKAFRSLFPNEFIALFNDPMLSLSQMLHFVQLMYTNSNLLLFFRLQSFDDDEPCFVKDRIVLHIQQMGMNDVFWNIYLTVLYLSMNF